MKPTPALLNHLAELLHNHYIAHRLQAGQTPATNPSLVLYAQLPEVLKQSNRDTARQLWGRLRTFGFELAPVDDAAEAISTEELMTHIEVLSELGHSCWMNNRFDQGWTYAPGPKNIEARTSPCLVAWHELPFEEQEKEREQIRDLPGILAAVKLRIIRSRRLFPRPDDLEGGEAAWVEAASPEAAPTEAHDEKVVLEPTSEMLDAVGRGLHEHYVKHRLAEGQNVYENPSLRPWERLAPALQHSNRNTARQLWHRLETVGYAIALLDAELPAVTQAEFNQHLESLAQLGHVCWMNERAAAGWIFAPGPKDLVKKTHPCMVPWTELPESEKKKEREQLQDIFEILHDAGLRIVLRPSRLNTLPDFTPISAS